MHDVPLSLIGILRIVVCGPNIEPVSEKTFVYLIDNEKLSCIISYEDWLLSARCEWLLKTVIVKVTSNGLGGGSVCKSTCSVSMGT